MNILKWLAIGVMALAFLAGAGAIAAWTWASAEIERPGPHGQDTDIMVAPGESLVSVANRLEADGVIRHARLMRLHARLRGAETRIKAGEFRLPAEASISDILKQLVEGRVITYRITLPEGLTTAQILARLEADPVLQGPVPSPPPEEGTLLPDTYQFPRGTTRAELLDRMAAAQDALLDELWPDRAADLPLAGRREAVILASVVEKETGADGERGLVASVFVNRLRRGMRLESDPTVIYGVSQGEPLFNEKGQRRPLYRSELRRETPWNTYQIDGLPLTPICNPGAGAISAVLNPPDSDYIFFVADGTGGHAFSKTLAAHNRNVQAYRAFEREELARERGTP